MGDWYEIKYLAGKYYIEFCNDDTFWQSTAVLLTPEQAEQVREFELNQSQEKKELLKSMLCAIKGK